MLDKQARSPSLDPLASQMVKSVPTMWETQL